MEQNQSAGPGAMLTKLREAQGISQETVANVLHLPLRFVKAMDTDNYEKGPRPAFAKGYLRGYARLLQVSPNELLDAFDQLKVSISEPMVTSAALSKTLYEVSTLHSQLRGLFLFGVFCLGAGLYAYNRYSQYISHYIEDVVQPFLNQLSETENLMPEVVLQTPPFLAVNDLARWPSFTSENLQAFQPITAAEQESLEGVQEVGDLSNLAMSFELPCWVSIKDGNQKRLLSGLMEPGKTITLRGLAPFYIVLGNASAAKLWLNGELVDISKYNENEVAKMKIAPPGMELSAIHSLPYSSLF